MPLLITNGEIVTATERIRADIWWEDETITQIGRDLPIRPGTEVIDASGKWIFPGFIDPHVHIHLPFMGTYATDNYTSASKAALLGGTTTLIEMCCPVRSEEPLEGLETWRRQAEGKSACDFTFHMGVTRFDSTTPGQLREIVNQGVASFKIFLAYKDAFGIDDRELYQTLRLAKELGVIVAAHCENETLIAMRQQELLSAGETGPAQHYESRPPRVEAAGVHHFLSFAELTGASAYIVHLSCEEALKEAQGARQRGVHVWIETLIQHLLLDKTFAELPNFEGAKYVMSPPLRDASHQAHLWSGLRSGLIHCVASDHAPFNFESQKTLGENNFTKIPNGIPALEDRINLLYTYGVKGGHIDLNTFVNVASTQVAKLFGLYPRKGAIQRGSDADLVIFDPSYRGIISAQTHSMKVDYSAFESWKIEGKASEVTVRGAVAVRGGQFVGSPSRGKFLRREPSHF